LQYFGTNAAACFVICIYALVIGKLLVALVSLALAAFCLMLLWLRSG
jgi:hypothetical protein